MLGDLLQQHSKNAFFPPLSLQYLIILSTIVSSFQGYCWKRYFFPTVMWTRGPVGMCSNSIPQWQRPLRTLDWALGWTRETCLKQKNPLHSINLSFNSIQTINWQVHVEVRPGSVHSSNILV